VVHTTIAPGLTAQADAKWVRLALTKLLENAWKFTGVCPEAHVEVGHTFDEGQEVFFVRDDGVGFDLAHSKRLFGLFRKLHTKEELGGTGGSLAIVHRIIERHDGRLWADAALDRGATFHFTLSARSV
jgi:light-regulated signal transduction histidine kinase (bacteriophytochrome)